MNADGNPCRLYAFMGDQLHSFGALIDFFTSSGPIAILSIFFVRLKTHAPSGMAMIGFSAEVGLRGVLAIPP